MKVVFLVVFLFLVGCGHASMRGSVAMKISDTVAHVCMDKDEVKLGDKVRLYKNVCLRDKKNLSCEKVAIGEGSVTKHLNDHYSEVTFAQPLNYDEGTFVEIVK